MSLFVGLRECTELKDIKSARMAIDDLIKRYPQSDAAKTGAERLKRLR